MSPEFIQLKNDILGRITSTQRYFSSGFGSEASIENRVAKGLIFVQLYAIYEKTVSESVNIACTSIGGANLLVRDLPRNLLSLALHPKLSSLQNCGRGKIWENRMGLLDALESSRPCDFTMSVFPNDGSHFREKQLDTIWKIFELSVDIVPRLNLRPLINELVEHRNAIAHGRSIPEDIGGRFTKAEIEEKMIHTQELCLHIISSIDLKCSQLTSL